MNSNISIVKNCSGCEICSNICPNQSIKIQKRNDGFLYPVILESCIHCGQCIHVCPMYNRKPIKNDEEHYFAFSHKNTDVLINSASGGLFTFFHSLFMREHPDGWTCGAVYSDDFSKVVHIISKSKKDFEKMRSSKYLQSEKKNIYLAVKKLLENNEAVFFTGSSCEVDALIRFLNKKYEKLWTMDYICKGTTTPKVFSDFINKLRKRYRSDISYVNMRYKWPQLDNWIPQYIRVDFSNGKHLQKEFYNTEPGLAFKILCRDSCKSCPYRESKHYSDFTIGDYHGPIKGKAFGNKLGTSVLIINSKRAFAIWDSIDKTNVLYEEIGCDEIYKYNRNDVDPRGVALAENLVKYNGIKAVRRTIGLKEKIKMVLPSIIVRKITMKKREMNNG